MKITINNNNLIGTLNLVTTNEIVDKKITSNIEQSIIEVIKRVEKFKNESTKKEEPILDKTLHLVNLQNLENFLKHLDNP